MFFYGLLESLLHCPCHHSKNLGLDFPNYLVRFSLPTLPFSLGIDGISHGHYILNLETEGLGENFMVVVHGSMLMLGFKICFRLSTPMET